MYHLLPSHTHRFVIFLFKLPGVRLYLSRCFVVIENTYWPHRVSQPIDDVHIPFLNKILLCKCRFRYYVLGCYLICCQSNLLQDIFEKSQVLNLGTSLTTARYYYSSLYTYLEFCRISFLLLVIS